VGKSCRYNCWWSSFLCYGEHGLGIAIFNNSIRLSSSAEILDNTQFSKSAVGVKVAKKIFMNKVDENRIGLNSANYGEASNKL
jgi:hypothetical protein